ncbi:MAG: MFS transporter [Alphaproteobacteria bacterium]|nr:MFS transporter [Alphaproteobacteria bacterium]
MTNTTARTAPNADAVARTRSLAAVLASILAVGITIGIATPLLSLLIEHAGHGAVMAGANAAVGTVAVVLVSPFVPRLVRAFGVLGSMYAGISISTVAMLLFPMTDNLVLWFVFRFVLGAGMAVLWVVGETWLNAATSPNNRGLVSGIYSTLLGVGFAAGPLVITGVGIDGPLPFMIGAVLVLVSALPLVLARRLAPRGVGEEEGGLLRTLTMAPLIMSAVFVCGFIDMAILSLLPLYGLRAGLDEQSALILLTVLISGTTVMQLPTGWLADRLGRFRLLISCAVVGTAAPLLVPAAMGNDTLLWPILFLWGGTTVSLYTIGLAMLGERFSPERLPAANAMMVISYCMGSIMGPPITGAAMEAWGMDAMPYGLALICGLFTLGALAGRLRASGE